jgi:hypothetical protein
MKTKRIITILFLACSTMLSAQNIQLSFGTTAISIPDTASTGDTIWYNCWVVNDGNTVITDYIALHSARFCQVDGMVSEREIGHINPFGLFPGDSIEFPSGLFYEVVQQQNYIIGDNIVVIWPRVEVPNTQINEHLSTEIYVFNSSMISGIKDVGTSNKAFFVFANNIIKFSKNLSVSKIALYNVLGKELYNISSPSRTVNLQHFSKGTYFLAVQFTDGTVKKEKIIVQ